MFINGCKAQPQTNSLQLTATISLPDVSGRIDHLAYDARRQIVFIAALGNNSVEVVDLKNRKLIHSIKNLHEPQGIIFLPKINSVFVANGGNGMCDVFNTKTFQKTNSIFLGDDADNVRYDSADQKIYVGYGNGGIAILDADNFKILSQIKLSGHPESFQIDKQQTKIFVNIPAEKKIEVIDLAQNRVVTQWEMSDATSNFPMALNEKNQRLFIGCRYPAKMLVLDSQTGRIIATLDIDGDVDDIFYNNSSEEIYLSCGSGYVDVFKQTDVNNFFVNGKSKTHSGARTSLFIAETNLLLVASPSSINRNAQLFIYEAQEHKE